MGLNNSSGLWGVGAIPSCLVPGPGVLRARGLGGGSGSGYKSSRKEVMGVLSLDGLVCI